MDGFLRDLVAKIEETVLDDDPVLDQEAEGDERVVGELPDDLKKFFTLISRRREALVEECQALHEETVNSMIRLMQGEKLDPRMSEHYFKHQELDLLAKLFWHCVWVAVPDARHAEVINLRRGWKITASKAERAESPITKIGTMISP